MANTKQMENSVIQSFKDTDINNLKKLIDCSINGTKLFRYFLKRDYKIINTHIVSKIFYINAEPAGYFHIERENDKYWFGILIADKYVGKGYSKKIIQEAIKNANCLKIDLTLSVDKINNIAFNLYKKNGFKIIEEKETYYLMEKKWLTL